MATEPMEVEADEEEYPSSDGKPMAETETHYLCLVLLAELLRDRYADREDVYVGSNLFVYYHRDGRRYAIAPDVFVAVGASRRPARRVFVVREERKAPDVLFEFTSASTRLEDEHVKPIVYRDEFKAREYFLFDPLGEYLTPPLRGFRLDAAGQYTPIEMTEGRLTSEVLGCDLIRSGGMLRLWDTATDSLVPTRAERLREERRLREEERRLRLAAEDEIAALRRQIEALRGQLPAE